MIVSLRWCGCQLAQRAWSRPSSAPGGPASLAGWGLSRLAQAGQEAVDAFEQRDGVLAEFAGGDHDVFGQHARLVGGLACAGDVEGDFTGAGGGLLHASRDLARRRILLLDRGGNGGGDAADLPDGVADAT